MFDPTVFFHFLKKPQYDNIERTQTNVIGTAIKIYLLTLLFVGLVSTLNTIILKAFLTLPVDETLLIPPSLKEHYWKYLISIGIFAPILEEVIFRLPLIFNPINISLSVSTLLALIVHKVSNGLLSIITLILFFSIVYHFSTIYNLGFLSFWTKNFRFIFYLLSLIFGLVHISNYKFIEVSQYFIAPILILPQLMLAFILSYTRLYYKKGFLICILIHSLMNMISILVFLLELGNK
jgi:membrane protease YdiL (CAAX protease family)